MATVGRKKRKRKPGAGTGVKVGAYTRSPRGPDTKNGKRKPTVHVDPYQRGKPDATKTKSASRRKKKRKATRKRKKRR